MARKYKVEITDAAHDDLDAHILYITEQLYAWNTANNLLDEFEKKILGLSDNPHKYAYCLDENLAGRGYRKFNVKNYIGLFLIDEHSETVIVARIFHGTMDYGKYI